MAVGDTGNGFDAEQRAPASRALRAALLGAHFAAWRRDPNNAHTLHVPLGLDRLLPMSTARLQWEVQEEEGADAEDAPNNHLRSCIAAALAPAQPDKKQLWQARRWNADLQRLLGDTYAEFDKNSSPNNSVQRPDPCMAYLCMREKCRQAAPSTRQGLYAPPDRKIVTEHVPDLDFDANTWITTASEKVTFDGVAPCVAEEIFQRADPRCWHKAVPDFFETSERGEWTARGWARNEPDARANPNDAKPLDRPPANFLLLEHVNWQLTPELDGGGINVLEITGFEHETAKFIKYDYRLYHCLQTKFLTTWEAGGLDVDEGTYQATLVDDDLHIVATKKLRYTQQQNLPPGFAGFLNLLAPSLTSLLMRQLAHDSVLKFLLSKEAHELAQKAVPCIQAPPNSFPPEPDTAVRKRGAIPRRAQASGRRQQSVQSGSRATSTRANRSNKQSGGAGRR